MPAKNGLDEDAMPDVHCLEAFALNQADGPVAHDHGPLGRLCTVQTDTSGGHNAVIVKLLPGIDILDLYRASDGVEVWKDGETSSPCYVPKKCVGWEFYSIIWPSPEGSSPILLGGRSVELLVGRPPADAVAPSILFAYVQAGHLYPRDSLIAPTAAKKGLPPPRTAFAMEEACKNMDADGRTMAARIVVLAPHSVYKDASTLPESPGWGLFIGPRSRTLVLLSKQRRVDLHDATLFGLDFAFQKGGEFISCMSRLFEPLGSETRVSSLFQNFDPLKVHCGLTGGTVIEHVDTSADGRSDYLRIFDMRLPSFFLSNSSDNLKFNTPIEASALRTHAYVPHAQRKNIVKETLPKMPVWALRCGDLKEQDNEDLLRYHDLMVWEEDENPVASVTAGTIMASGSQVLLRLLGHLRKSSPHLDAIAGCHQVTPANGQPGIATLPPAPMATSYGGTAGSYQGQSAESFHTTAPSLQDGGFAPADQPSRASGPRASEGDWSLGQNSEINRNSVH